MPLLLLTTIFLPLLGALLLHGDRAVVRRFALATAVATFVGAAVLIGTYPRGADAFAATDFAWFGGSDAPVDVRFSVALDGLSLWLFGLTSLLSITAVLVGWEAIKEQATLYYRLLLILETGMLGVFVARDIILFYVFFEFTLIPLFFLIGIWGSEQRRYAAIKFFLFTLAGSLLTFLGLLAIVIWDYSNPIAGAADWKMTFSIPMLTEHFLARPMDEQLQLWLFLALFAGFAIKVPLFPLHTWLPLAHVQAPTAGSVILAGILLKIGTYGFLRFNLAMLPHASAVAMPWMLGLAAAGIIYGSFVALAQKDLKKLIAYSSVAHLGFCMLGLFAADPRGIEGGTLQMINHGLSTGGLFAMVGMLYERYHTRQIADYGGLAAKLPVLSFFMLVLTLSSIGLPGLNGFVGEFLILLGGFERAWLLSGGAETLPLKIISVLAVSGVVLGAWYMLWMYQRIFFGPLKEPITPEQHAEVHDLSAREIVALVPLMVFIVWIGVYPRFFLDRMSPTVERMTASVQSIANNAQTSETSKSETSKSEPRGLSPRLKPPTVSPNRAERIDLSAETEKRAEGFIPAAEAANTFATTRRGDNPLGSPSDKNK
jgi:NADH-quinone oxidoreductase subunit M